MMQKHCRVGESSRGGGGWGGGRGGGGRGGGWSRGGGYMRGRGRERGRGTGGSTSTSVDVTERGTGCAERVKASARAKWNAQEEATRGSIVKITVGSKARVNSSNTNTLELTVGEEVVEKGRDVETCDFTRWRPWPLCRRSSATAATVAEGIAAAAAAAVAAAAGETEAAATGESSGLGFESQCMHVQAVAAVPSSGPPSVGGC
ncbi:unnamed protein product [Closterium sp. NIES-53]